MNRLIIPSLAAVFAMATAAPGANAQAFSSNPFQIGGSAGIAFPTGDLGTTANTGYNVTLIGGYKPVSLPVGIRVEAAYNEFGLEGTDGNVNIPAFTGNLVYELPSVSFRPYVIGGGGLYRTNIDVAGGGSAGENDFGFNIGGGIKIPLSTSFDTFVEARYNHVASDGVSRSFIPVTVGILW